MSKYQVGAHTKHSLKVHLVWITKYRRKALTKEIAIRARDLLKEIAKEHGISILSGKVVRDHVHVLVEYAPTMEISSIVQWLKGASSRMLFKEYGHLRERIGGKHLWARGFLAVSTGAVTDEMIQKYIDEQEGEPVLGDNQVRVDRNGRIPSS